MNLYGVYVTIDGIDKWGLTRRKREALKFAKRHRGYVHKLDDSGWGSPSSWDAPTFRVTADRIADFRDCQ